jgi:hypothetical protein
MDLRVEEKRKAFLEEIKKKIKRGENNCDVWKRTILWRVLGFSPVDIAIVKRVVGYGADVNSKNLFDESVLHVAIKFGLIDIAKYLIEHGADVNCKDQNGYTVLYHAIKNGSLRFLKYLLERGVQINWEEGNDGKQALHFALRNGSVEMVQSLLACAYKQEGKYGKFVLVVQYCSEITSCDVARTIRA